MWKQLARPFALAFAATALTALASCGSIGVDRRDEHGMSALMRAARTGDSVEAARLIALGADVNTWVPSRDLRELVAFLSFMQQLPTSDIGYTPLMYAAQSGHTGVAKLLIQKGADAQHVARLQETPLQLAIMRSDLAMLRLLAAAGARPDARQFSLAVTHSTPETVAFLLERGANPNDLPHPQPTGPPPVPLTIMAAGRGDTGVLRVLIGAGANANARDRNGWSALRWARRNADQSRAHPIAPRIVEMLVAAGARDESGARADALFKAMFDRNVEGVRQALRDGASPNAKDDRGVPPIIWAASHGEAEIVAALVDAGADVNASPQYDTTPLNAAIRGGSVAAVKKLLAAGASIDRPDYLRQTPLQTASSWKRTEMTALLVGSSAKTDSAALAIAALNGEADQVRSLLVSGANPNASGGNALSEATRGCQRRDNADVIRMLLEAGADPKAPGVDYTPLHRAAGLCKPEVVRMLLERGADPNARDMSGNTPLIGAAGAGNLENVRLLIAARADVNAKDDYGKSVLAYAALYPEVQQELRRAGAR